MARREWAGNKVSDAQRRHPKLSMVEIAGLVAEAEHARSVRIVKAEIKRVQLDERNYGISEQILLIAVLEKLLAKLQRGRGGKG